MTKEEIRALTISKARIREGDFIADIGSGTGSITVEAALQVGPKGRVYAIDNEDEAVKLTRTNCERFGVQNLVEIIHGTAPEAIHNLPEMDVMIIGGGSSELKEIVDASMKKLKPGGHMVLNSILVETSYNALQSFKSAGLKDIEVINVSIATGKKMGWGTMLLARNPINIVCGVKP